MTSKFSSVMDENWLLNEFIWLFNRLVFQFLPKHEVLTHFMFHLVLKMPFFLGIFGQHHQFSPVGLKERQPYPKYP